MRTLIRIRSLWPVAGREWFLMRRPAASAAVATSRWPFAVVAGRGPFILPVSLSPFPVARSGQKPQLLTGKGERARKVVKGPRPRGGGLAREAAGLARGGRGSGGRGHSSQNGRRAGDRSADAAARTDAAVGRTPPPGRTLPSGGRRRQGGRRRRGGSADRTTIGNGLLISGTDERINAGDRGAKCDNRSQPQATPTHR